MKTEPKKTPRSTLLLRAATLSEYLAAKLVRETKGGIEFTVHPGWPLPGENRLGYSQLIRLIEVAREAHWCSMRRGDGVPALDSALRWIEVYFDAPVVVSRRYRFAIKVNRIGKTSYDLEVRCEDVSRATTAVRAILRSVLVDATDMKPIAIPITVRQRLASLTKGRGPHDLEVGVSHVNRRARVRLPDRPVPCRRG